MSTTDYNSRNIMYVEDIHYKTFLNNNNIINNNNNNNSKESINEHINIDLKNKTFEYNTKIYEEDMYNN